MAFNHLPISQYETLLHAKAEHLKTLMTPFAAPAIDIFPSEKQHYRMRAEFRIWHEGDDLYHIMFDSESKARIRVDNFPPASLLINQLMQEVMNEIRANKTLRHKLFQIDYLSTLSQQALISFIYHKNLDDEWTAQAQQLKAHLQEKGFNVSLIGRAAKQKICLDKDYVDECLTVAGQEIIYRQVENSFTQPNAYINIKMLEWAFEITQHATGDLLELYCGNGNFSLALARNFERVLATEIAKSSVAAAQYNIEVNHIDNVEIVRMSAEEFTQALNKEREFKRLRGVNLDDYQCNTVFVDPPRSGLDDETLKMVQAYPTILYISCNPETLAQNLTTLTQTHRIERLALFDQFPYTHHMESGVLLVRK